MSERFRSSLVESGDGFGWLLFDLQKRVLVEPLCDYADDMILTAQLSRLTVDQEMGYLRGFWAYLASEGLSVNDVSDRRLKMFRADAFARTVRGPSHRGSEEAAKATTNAKLVRIYDWLRWLVDTGRSDSGLIGSNGCRVTSTLEASSVLHPGPRRDLGGRYPLLFRLKAGRSKHRLPKFLPDERTVDAVHSFFHVANTSAHVVSRNCLIATIASYTGFRRASIQSLQTSQFIGSDFVRTDRDSVIIQPLRQKFGYGNVFEIPGWLHGEVAAFIGQHRKQLVDRLGVSASRHRGIVFLSDRTGTPLDDRSFSALMSRALRAAGAGKGASMHAWRGKFAVEEAEEAYQLRREGGLDTSITTMDAVLARALGHQRSESARPYTANYEASEVSRRRAARDSERQSDKRRVRELEAELERLLHSKHV